MAKSDGDGRFTIENLPVGAHVFRLWHERAGYLRNVKSRSLATDSKGRLAVTIREGHNELIDSRLPPHIFDGK
jgi:hypothetical protein